MSGKLKFKIEPDNVRACLRECKLNYAGVEEATNGEITENQLKHFMNKGLKIDEETLRLLADTLQCEPSELLKSEELLSLNIPSEINLLIKDLYLRKREDIQPTYAGMMKQFKNEVELKEMVRQVHRLFHIFTVKDAFLNKDLIVQAVNIILDDFQKRDCLASRFTQLSKTDVNGIFEQLTLAEGSSQSNQLLLIFSYVLCIFDVIFLGECIATALQTMPERNHEQKAFQFCDLTYRSERLRNSLLDLVLYNKFKFNDKYGDIPIEDTGLNDELIKVIMLVLAAGEQCYRHLEGDYSDSEYVNRATLGAILKRLEQFFGKWDIPLRQEVLSSFVCTRFAWKYLEMQASFRALNPPKAPVNKYRKGFWNGIMAQEMRFMLTVEPVKNN